jgi:hypothetical protein
MHMYTFIHIYTHIDISYTHTQYVYTHTYTQKHTCILPDHCGAGIPRRASHFVFTFFQKKKAFVFDSSLALAVLGFLGVHLKFVYYNQVDFDSV